MSTRSKTHRVYCFDAARRMLTAEWIEACDDAEAIAKAEAKGFGSKCEIWEGRRMVADLAAELKQA